MESQLTELYLLNSEIVVLYYSSYPKSLTKVNTFSLSVAVRSSWQVHLRTIRLHSLKPTRPAYTSHVTMNVLTNQEPHHVSTSHSCLHAIGGGQRQEGHFHQNCSCPTEGIYVGELSSVINPGGYTMQGRLLQSGITAYVAPTDWLSLACHPCIQAYYPVNLSRQEEVSSFSCCSPFSFIYEGTWLSGTDWKSLSTPWTCCVDSILWSQPCILLMAFPQTHQIRLTPFQNLRGEGV